MDFSIIIVSFNVKERLRINLQALAASTGGVSFEVIVIDNASTDGTIEMMKTEFPDIRLLVNDENQGFARASNQGLREAQGQYHILLNPDMKVFPTTLIELLVWLKVNPQADVTGIRLIDEQAQYIPQVRRFPTWWDQTLIILKLPHLFPGLLNQYLRKDFDYSQAAIVDSLRGAFFVIRQSALRRFGYLDERYFLWFEEVDYCRQVKEQGGQVWYTPAAQAIDYVGQSFATLPRKQKQHYFQTSMLAYFRKWEGSWQVNILIVAWWLSNVIVKVGDHIKLRSRIRT